MKKRIITLAVSVICMCMLSGCVCAHEWLDAACTTAKTCSRCGETEGEPAGHITENWVETVDFIQCIKRLEQICPVCGQLLETKEENMDSFSADERFAFSPKEFMERMKSAARQEYPDFSYEFTYGDAPLRASVYLNDTASPDAVIRFFKDTNQYVTGSEFEADNAGLWCVELSHPKFGAVDDLGSLISEDILELLCLTCDPLLTDNDYRDFAVTKTACALNAAEYGEPWGYYEKNGLLYEFCHYADIELCVSVESILVYAADWR